MRYSRYMRYARDAGEKLYGCNGCNGCNAGEKLYEPFERLCLRNSYATTIACCNSAIVKLGKLTQVCKVYRGIAGRRLPD